MVNGSADMRMELVPRYDVFEITLESTASYGNPFTDVVVTAEFTSPYGRKFVVYGFYDGGNIWKIRFAPDEIGIWHYVTSASDDSNTELHGKTGVFNCVSSSNKGFIRVDPSSKYWFSSSDGSPFFGLGDTCYGMVNCIGDSQRIEYLDARSSNKFNFVRFFASGFPHACHPSLADKPYWPWGGTPETPDFDRFNPAFFQRLEGILGELKQRGMYAEILVFNLYMLENKHGNHTGWFTPPARQEQWVRYLVSRLAAYPSVFLWTIANEYQLYPDGIYRYDGPSDDRWVCSIGGMLHKYDPFKHPTTVHPEGAIRYPGHVFGHRSEIDVLTQQQNSYASATWIPNPLPGYYDGPGNEAGLDILSDRWYDKPVINTENGYEWLEAYPTNDSQQTHGTDKCRCVAWRIFVSGGASYAAGFSGSAMGRDGDYRYNRKSGKTDGPVPFTTANMGLSLQLSYYHDFITQKTDFRKMHPHMELVNKPNLCLADMGHEYVVYAPTGGSVVLDLSNAEGLFSGEWLNPRSGVYSGGLEVAGGAKNTFHTPDNDDWVLHLTHRITGTVNVDRDEGQCTIEGRKSVVLNSPIDGGFPRGLSDIEEISDNCFRINIPSPEDSHIMVEAVNSSDSKQEITIEIHPDPRMAVSRWAQEPKSHFYYRTPAGKWFRRHLEDDETPRLTIPLEPGVTRIAGVPYYTYSEYVSYVESINDPRVTKEVMFTHEKGAFKVYRLTVTNPGGVRDKLRICYGRPGHANETIGFYMAQGIIEWLLSGDKAANMDNIEWSFYLCPDPKAFYYHYAYEEIAREIYDTGNPFEESYFDALKSGRHHIFVCQHMWNNEHGGIMKGSSIPVLEMESYEYHDPLSDDSTDKLTFPDLAPSSRVWKAYTSYCPHWYEYGTDTYFHRDGRFWDYKIPGMLMMNNEIIFYGKDSGGDLIKNIKEQGKQWARATSQVYLQFQQEHGYWTKSHPMGEVDVNGVFIIPMPEHMLLEKLIFLNGNAARGRNADGGPMVIFRKRYDHGLGMRAGDSVTFDIPAGANGFMANVAMDDVCTSSDGALQFTVVLDGEEVWRSNVLGLYESQMAHIRLPGKGRLTLSVEGSHGALANWGGAKFIVNDPDTQVCD